MVQYIEVRVERKYRRIWLRQVKYFMSDVRMIEAHMEHGEIIRFYGRLDNLEKEIEEAYFLRCHKSFLVNGVWMDILKRSYVQIGEERIPVSRRCYENMREKGLIGEESRRIRVDRVEERPVAVLVEVQGCHKGDVKKLYGGENDLRMSESGDVDVTVGNEDGSLQASITYDIEQTVFYIYPHGEEGAICLDKRPLERERQLTANSILQIEDVSLLFIPICGMKFQW